MYLTPSGYTDVLYRHWILPQAVKSPLPSTIISSVSPPRLYHGPTDHASWFSAIFGPSPQRVSRVTLILSSGTPYRTGLPTPLATLDSLTEVVEVHRVVPFLPTGHIGRPSHAHPGSLPSDRCFESPPAGARRTVYVHLHCSAGFSPLHSVLGTGIFRICLLYTSPSPRD